MNTKELQSLLKEVVQIAQHAGDLIKAIFLSGEPLNKQIKADNSPVTDADQLAHDFITKELMRLTPKIPIISEENTNILDFNTRQNFTYHWLVDPLDGTKSFIRGEHEFSVNIALIHQRQAILGVIDVPMYEQCYAALLDAGCYLYEKEQPPVTIQTRPCEFDKPTIIVSRDHSSQHGERLTKLFGDYAPMQSASAFKFCLLAAGQADIYPRFSPCMEWDSAAGQCIVEAAGGLVLELDWRPLSYNHKDSLVNPAFVVIGDPSISDKLKHLIK